MNTEQRMDELEELIQRTLLKIQELEKRKTEFPEVHIPDYTPQLAAIQNELIRLKHSYPVEKMNDQIERMEKLSRLLPEIIQVRHHHHIQGQSKGFIIGGLILLFSTAIAIGLAGSLWKENGLLNENSVKFRMIRQNYPDIAYWADTLYHRNPDSLKQLTEKIETEQVAAAQAEAAAREKVQDAKKARRKVNELQKKLKSR
jgi:hypothetical protein